MNSFKDPFCYNVVVFFPVSVWWGLGVRASQAASCIIVLESALQRRTIIAAGFERHGGIIVPVPDAVVYQAIVAVGG